MSNFSPSFFTQSTVPHQGMTMNFDNDPFHGAPISQAQPDSSMTYEDDTAPSSLDRSEVPRSSSINTSLSNHSQEVQHGYVSSASSSASALRNFQEVISKFEITNDTPHLLESIDPTFWSLETYIQTCSRISLESKNILPFAYYSSLVMLASCQSPPQSSATLLPGDDQDYDSDSDQGNEHEKEITVFYYDKSCFVRHPLKTSVLLKQALETIQDWMNQNQYLNPIKSSSPTSTFASSDRDKPTHSIHIDIEQIQRAQVLEDLRLTVSRFIFVLDQLDRNGSDVECYQSSNWPNLSSTEKFVGYFPQFNELLPIRRTSNRAESCLDAFLPQLETLIGQVVNPLELETYTLLYDFSYNQQVPSSLPVPPLGNILEQRQQTPWWMRTLAEKVQSWQTLNKNKKQISHSPRKRSFTAMDDDVVGQFRRPSDVFIKPRPRKLRRPSL